MRAHYRLRHNWYSNRKTQPTYWSFTSRLMRVKSNASWKKVLSVLKQENTTNQPTDLSQGSVFSHQGQFLEHWILRAFASHPWQLLNLRVTTCKGCRSLHRFWPAGIHKTIHNPFETQKALADPSQVSFDLWALIKSIRKSSRNWPQAGLMRVNLTHVGKKFFPFSCILPL